MAETSSYGRVSRVTRVSTSRAGGSGGNIFDKMIPVMISMNKGIDILCEKVEIQLNVLSGIKNILMQQLDISKKQLENSDLTLKLAEQERDAAREALYESRFDKKQKIPERIREKTKTDSDLFSSIRDFMSGLGLGFLRVLGPMLLALAGLGKYVMALKLPKSIELLMKGLKFLKDSFLKIFNVASDIFKFIGKIGGKIGAVFLEILGSLGTKLKNSFLTIITVIGDTFGRIVKFIREIDLMDNLSRLGNGIKNALFGESGIFGRLITTLKNIDYGLLGRVADDVGNILKDTKNAIIGESGFMTRLFKSVKELNIVDNLTSLLSNLKNKLFSQIDITENAKSLATNIKNVFVGETGVFTKIQNLFSADGALGKTFIFITDIGTSVGNVISDSFTGIKNLFFGESGAIAKIKKFFGPEGPLSFLGNLFSADGAFSKFFRIITDLFPFVKWLTGPLAIAIFTLIDFATGFMKGFDEGGLLGGIKEGTLEVIRGIFTKPLDLLKDLASWIAEKLGFEEFSKFLDNFSFTATFDDFIGKIENAFSAGGIISAIENGLVGVLDVIVAKPIDLVKDIVSWISNKLGFSSISKSLDSFSFTDVFSNVANAASNLFKSAIKSVIPGGLDKYLPDSLTKWLNTESKMTSISSSTPAPTETPTIGATARTKAATSPSTPSTTPPTSTKPQVNGGILSEVSSTVGSLAETGKQNLAKVTEFANIAFNRGAQFAAPVVETVKGGLRSLGGVKDLVVNNLVSAGITSKRAISNILSQVWAESKFKPRSEDLNYSAEGLNSTFPAYFPTKEIAEKYSKKPEKIANKVYANRMGNGPESSGDGWKYRGRGFIQITGKDAYAQASKYLGIDLLSNPDKANEPMIAAKLIPWFFLSYKRKKEGDLESIDKVSKAVGFVGSKNTMSAKSMERKEAAKQFEAALNADDSGVQPVAVSKPIPTQQVKPASVPAIVPTTPRTGANLNQASVELTTVKAAPAMPVVINNVDNSTKNNTSILGGMGSSRNRENSFLDIIDYNWKHTYY